MDFMFFDAADVVLFTRNDAESATWTVEERNLQALFPYNPGKVVERGQRIGFYDDTGAFQVFEVRRVRSYEPDHYQEITAEHIVIAELTDEHYSGAEVTDQPPGAVLAGLLTGTLWTVGNVTATNLSSANINTGSVYQNLRTIETNWNVYITPRVTFGSTGITGRYLDIAPAEPEWSGIRLSVDKNADELGVTIDDTETLTALFGYGQAVSNGVPLTFEEVEWTATADHPAKPVGQTYLEDPAATALYGRNGRPRFGYYQNSDISDPEILLQKTWEALKATNAPRVSIDCMVRDLRRLGYADQPIRLHHSAVVTVEPMGVSYQLEIIRLTVDLLDPTATRPTIGAYIPNIIYINRETATRVSGGGGGGGGGRRGQTAAEQQISEFETEIAANNYQISLRAYQRNMAAVETTLREAGIGVTADGVVIYAGDTNFAAKITTTVNNSGSAVYIDADKIYLDGQTIVDQLAATDARIANLMSGEVQATYLRANKVGAVNGEFDHIKVSDGASGLKSAAWKSEYVVTSRGIITMPSLSLSQREVVYISGGQETSGNYYLITSYTAGSVGAQAGKTIYYLGSDS